MKNKKNIQRQYLDALTLSKQFNKQIINTKNISPIKSIDFQPRIVQQTKELKNHNQTQYQTKDFTQQPILQQNYSKYQLVRTFLNNKEPNKSDNISVSNQNGGKQNKQKVCTKTTEQKIREKYEPKMKFIQNINHQRKRTMPDMKVQNIDSLNLKIKNILISFNARNQKDGTLKKDLNSNTNQKSRTALKQVKLEQNDQNKYCQSSKKIVDCHESLRDKQKQQSFNYRSKSTENVACYTSAFSKQQQKNNQNQSCFSFLPSIKKKYSRLSSQPSQQLAKNLSTNENCGRSTILTSQRFQNDFSEVDQVLQSSSKIWGIYDDQIKKIQEKMKCFQMVNGSLIQDEKIPVSMVEKDSSFMIQSLKNHQFKGIEGQYFNEELQHTFKLNLNLNTQTQRSKFCRLVQSFLYQINLDRQFIQHKKWFSLVTQINKWEELKKEIINKNEELPFLHDYRFQQQFQINSEELDPFQTIKGKTFSIEKFVQMYIKCQTHWNCKILHKFDENQLIEGQIYEILRKDICESCSGKTEKDVAIENIVRYLNIKSGQFLHKRDLILIFRRLSIGKEKKLSLQKLIQRLSL